jgi:LCP family protein required for cell wall assembly
MALGGLVVAGLLAAVALVAVNRQPGEGLRQSVTQTVANLLEGGQPENILLIGNNARGATTPLAPGQADLLFVVHLDPVHHQVVFISIPRNAMVAYPGYRDPIPKIKSALLMGGPQLEAQTVSRFLGMPIQGYVVADFAGFAAAINAVGGVWIDIPARLYDPLHSHANFEPGYQHLNGKQALAYVRIRQNEAGNGYRVNDYQRMTASFQLMEALKRQVLQRATPATLSRLVGVLRTDFATNLSSAQILGLLASADHATFRHVTVGRLADSMILASTPLPGVNLEGAITGAYYDIITPQEIEADVGAYGAKNPDPGIPPLPNPATVRVSVTNNAEGQLLAARIRAAGCSVTLGGPPASSSVVVLYPPGELTAGELVGRAVGLSNETVEPGAVSQVEVETP